MDPWESQEDFLVDHSALLLASHRGATGRDLLESTGDPLRDARRLWEAPFAVLSSRPGPGAVLNYGNATALELWETDWATLTSMPSAETAEPDCRAERAEFLQRVREQGFIDDYSGVRISRAGRRFRILRATVWNIGSTGGQAATFASWNRLDNGPGGAMPWEG